MKNTGNIGEKFMLLLRSGIIGDVSNDEIVNNIGLDDLSGIFDFSTKHDIAHIAGNVLLNAGLLYEKTYEEMFLQSQIIALYRYEWIKSEEEMIFVALEKSGIDFMPLKGSVIRKYYPDPSVRISSDIDILIKKDDIGRASELLCGDYDYTREFAGSHDISFYKGKMHIELHFSLFDDDFKLKSAFDNVWSDARLVSGSAHRYEMTNEFFALYIILHILKHFIYGGCGIRQFVDLQIIKSRMKPDKDALQKLLDENRLSEFYNSSMEMLDVWFGDKEHSDLTRDMQNYIFGSGIYGNISNYVTASVIQKGGKLKYLISRIFMPFDRLCIIYPKLRGRKLLYPFYLVKRCFRIVFGGRLKSAAIEINVNRRLTDDYKSGKSKLLDNLGLKKLFFSDDEG